MARGAAGFTLVEVLVALAVLAGVGGALLGLQAATARAVRAAERLHTVAALARDELALHRVVTGATSGPCLSSLPGPEWRCAVERSCIATALGPCALVAIRVVVEPPDDAPFEARTVHFPALEGRP